MFSPTTKFWLGGSQEDHGIWQTWLKTTVSGQRREEKILRPTNERPEACHWDIYIHVRGSEHNIVFLKRLISSCSPFFNISLSPSFLLASSEVTVQGDSRLKSKKKGFYKPWEWDFFVWLRQYIQYIYMLLCVSWAFKRENKGINRSR